MGTIRSNGSEINTGKFTLGIGIHFFTRSVVPMVVPLNKANPLSPG